MDPKVCSENHHMTMMEEEGEPREEPEDYGPDDLQHFGENYLHLHIVLQCFSSLTNTY